jgi:hypothetical protein
MRQEEIATIPPEPGLHSPGIPFVHTSSPRMSARSTEKQKPHALSINVNMSMDKKIRGVVISPVHATYQKSPVFVRKPEPNVELCEKWGIYRRNIPPDTALRIQHGKNKKKKK